MAPFKSGFVYVAWDDHTYAITFLLGWHQISQEDSIVGERQNIMDALKYLLGGLCDKLVFALINNDAIATP